MMTMSVIGCGWGLIAPATTAFTQTLKPRPVTRLGRATASALGCAVKSMSALARINSLTSGSGSTAGGGGGSGCRKVFGMRLAAWSASFGMKLAAWSVRSHAASAMAQATSIVAIFIAGMAAPVARLRGDWPIRSARARRAQDLARGRAPLAAVRPRLLRTGPGRRDWTRLRLVTANGESIALGGDGRGVCCGHGRGGRRPYLGAGGERGHHGGADGEHDRTGGKPESGH